MLMTIGSSVWDDYSGAFFTFQHIRATYKKPVDFICVDNKGDSSLMQFCREAGVRYIQERRFVGTSYTRDLIFREAKGDVVMVLDAHVILDAGAVEAVVSFFEANPESKDLLHGPILHNNFEVRCTHMTERWRPGGLYFGCWDGRDGRGLDQEGPPFEIPMMGLGAFACRQRAWVGFSRRFHGFGVEEGYIHDKFRMAGGRVLCLPAFRWVHRFHKPGGVTYPMSSEGKFRNYILARHELGQGMADVVEAFKTMIAPNNMEAIIARATGGVFDLARAKQCGRQPWAPP